MRRRTPIAPLAVASLMLVISSPAQDKPRPQADRLQALLGELAGLDAETWRARIQALEERAKTHEASAAELRSEIERLKALHKLIGSQSRPSAQATPQPASAKTASRPASSKAAPVGSAKPAAQPVAKAGELITWDKHIARILEDQCSSCHDPDDKKGGLDVSTFAAARQGGGSGRSIVPGDPEQSRLYKMIAQQERPYMPKDGDPLPPDVVQRIKTWIEQGAAEDADGALAFLAAKDAKAQASAAATAGDSSGSAGPMPVELPRIPLRTVARSSPVKSLAKSPRAPLLAMPGQRQVLLFDPKLQRIGVLECPLAQVELVAFSSDGATLLAAGGEPGRSGQVVLYDVRTGAQRGTYGKEKDTPLAAAVHTAAGFVALGGSGKSVRVYRIADGSEVFAGKHDDFVLALEFAPDGRLLAAGDRAGNLVLWETKGGRIGQSITAHRGGVNAVAFHPSGKQIASAGADGTLRLWEIGDAKQVWSQPAHQGEALALAFRGTEALTSAGSDGVVKLWTSAGKAIASSPAADEWLYSVAFGEGEETIYAGDWQGRVHRFDLRRKEMKVVGRPIVAH